MPKGKIWGNIEKEKEVLKWINQGKTVVEIMKEFKTSCAVISKIKRKFGIPVKKIKNTQRAKGKTSSVLCKCPKCKKTIIKNIFVQSPNILHYEYCDKCKNYKK